MADQPKPSRPKARLAKGFRDIEGDELRISVVSDDNYNHAIQNTVLYQFALLP